MTIKLKWQQTWTDAGFGSARVNWFETWGDDGTHIISQVGKLALQGAMTFSAPRLNMGPIITQSGALALHGTLGITGQLGFTNPAAVPFNLVQSGAIGVTGVLSHSAVLGRTIPYYFDPVGGLPVSTIGGALGVGGQVGRTTPKNLQILAPLALNGDITVLGGANLIIVDPGVVRHNLVQVGAIAITGTHTVTGDIATSATRKNLVQSGVLGLVGTFALSTGLQIRGPKEIGPVTLTLLGMLQTQGNILAALPFNLAQSGSIDITGVLTHDAPDLHGVTPWALVPVGPIAITGTLTHETEITPRRGTEGLPANWRIEQFLETVPNPNYGTAYGNNYFQRWTWKGFDEDDNMVAASGSEQDCFAQTLSVAQSRFVNWRDKK